MKKIIFIAVLLALCTVLSFADKVLDKADKYFDDEQYAQGYAYTEKELKPGLSKEMQAELYWRLARFTLYLGDDLVSGGADKKKILATYTKGEEFAEKAIELHPGADAYYWRCSNMGKYGETKGVLNSLNKAKPMRDDLEVVLSYDREYADAFYVLSRLYFLLPGGIISFGDKDAAVSYARRAIKLYKEADLKISYYHSLAEILYDRNWDAEKRQKKLPKMKKKYDKADDDLKKMGFYEYTLGLKFSPPYINKKIGEMSDREEARAIVAWVKAEYKKIAKPDKGEIGDMKDLVDMAAGWD